MAKKTNVKTNPTEVIVAVGEGIGGALAAGILQKKLPDKIKNFAPAITVAGGLALSILVANKHVKNVGAGMAVLGGVTAIGQIAKNNAMLSKIVPSLSGWDENTDYQPTYPVSGFGNPAIQFEGVGEVPFEGIEESDLEGYDDAGNPIEGVTDIESGTAYVEGIGQIDFE